MLVFLIVLCVFCIAMAIFSGTTQKKEKTFKEENKDNIANLDKEYATMCSDLYAKENRFYPNHVTIEEKYKNDTQLKLAKTSSNELAWYQYKKPQKYHISGVTNYSIVPNKRGELTEKEKIAINQIMFFREIGSVQYTTSISGGGVNVAGAVVGGMIAGTAGAIVGGREAVKSTTETHDDRKIVVKFNDGKERIFDYKYYTYFIRFMPEKEYSFVMAKSHGAK